MEKTKRTKTIIVVSIIAVILLVLAFLVGSFPKTESVVEMISDAVLHNENRISLFGLVTVNPSLASGFIVTGIMLPFALIIRLFVIPKFTMVPGRLQMLLEGWVGIFDGMAKSSSPHRNKFLGVYIFGVGSYIFVGTLIELLGIQLQTTRGTPISLPAPMADINGTICMALVSYLVIMSGGIAGNGPKGIFKTLKEFSLPFSLCFRLFGALLSGLLVTELVYYNICFSILLPVVIGVVFTLLHAVIQAYVLTMLTALFYGEVSE